MPFGGIGVVIMSSRMRVAITILDPVRPHAASVAGHHGRLGFSLGNGSREGRRVFRGTVQIFTEV